jgi:hypothetical protein
MPKNMEWITMMHEGFLPKESVKELRKVDRVEEIP